jgi:hypothetical protein
MMHLLALIVDHAVFLDERDGTDIVLAGSLNEVGITDVDFFFLSF